ncbi:MULTISPECIES: ketopantoate reductase family protein [Gammaproteobacteria]|uniref:ketopantoate reductase family protein n=1 Tax=Gammaproteobacteria TaxID=1236 RepID=UPI000DD0D464|nr:MULTISPECIES: 2-dehydropantoate 2-reductase [Gammaproteobacteria]RTE86009.1 2-dehydropantoate 2-reductase [Aliidiomarina sp. B3213]TCZ91363.1 2-dehydropantoate 2-reductase [Lysobacter sp. N42]
MSSYEWNIVGHGNLASILASRLAKEQQHVRFVLRSVVAKKSVQLSVNGHTDFNGEIETYQHASSPITARQIWVLPLKAWQLSEAIHEHQQSLRDADAIIFSHNGLGAGEEAIATLGDIPLYDWVTTHGAFRQESSVKHSGCGESWIGPRNANQQQPEFVSTLQQALPPFHWDPNIQMRRWQKLAMNCAINPLAAGEKLLNGALLNPKYKPMIEGVCSEIAQVIAVELPQSDLNSEALVASVYKTIEHTQENANSMLQDINNNRATEIDFLNGYVIKKGQEHNIPTPFNQELFNSIKRL